MQFSGNVLRLFQTQTSICTFMNTCMYICVNAFLRVSLRSLSFFFPSSTRRRRRGKHQTFMVTKNSFGLLVCLYRVSYSLNCFYYCLRFKWNVLQNIFDLVLLEPQICNVAPARVLESSVDFSFLTYNTSKILS